MLNIKKNIIFIIGPMCSGKSTIGEILSKKILFNFYDSDIEISKLFNNNINNIFKEKGELFFRKEEEKFINNIILMDNIIVSTGGGIIESNNNRKIIKNNGIVIFLDVNIYNQYKRLNNNNINRPLLGDNKNKYFENLSNIYNKRINFYREISDIIIDTNKLNEEFIISKIIKIFKNKKILKCIL